MKNDDARVPGPGQGIQSRARQRSCVPEQDVCLDKGNGGCLGWDWGRTGGNGEGMRWEWVGMGWGWDGSVREWVGMGWELELRAQLS